MPRLPIAFALAALALPGAAAAQQDKPIPDGLMCPPAAGGAELISTALASAEPGVTGLCVYYIYDEENPDRNATLTLRAGNAGYDADQTFKAPKIDLGGMRLAEEATRPMPFGGGTMPATVIALTGAEADLGPITDVFNTLIVFRLAGRAVSLETEYTNVSAGLQEAPQAALLAAQRP